jgi:hypothetical protein
MYLFEVEIKMCATARLRQKLSCEKRCELWCTDRKLAQEHAKAYSGRRKRGVMCLPFRQLEMRSRIFLRW